MNTRTLPVELSITRGETSRAVAVVVDHSFGARVMRALGAWLVCWVLAGLSVFIHILHLFLVPGFLIGGVVLCVRRAREASSLVKLEGACPRCKVTRTRVDLGPFFDGCRVHCDGCGNSATVRMIAPDNVDG